jgi:hypothetical protein
LRLEQSGFCLIIAERSTSGDTFRAQLRHKIALFQNQRADAYHQYEQTVYYFKQPKAIPAGTKIMVTGYFDNSGRNRYNPDPAKAVRYGEPTNDEMMIGWMDYTADKESVKDSPLSEFDKVSAQFPVFRVVSDAS